MLFEKNQYRAVSTPHRRADLTFTPKAFANFSPVVGAQRQPWGTAHQQAFEPYKGYDRTCLTLSGLIVFFYGFDPRVVAALQPLG